MWTSLAMNKNIYLQKTCQGINPIILNRCVDIVLRKSVAEPNHQSFDSEISVEIEPTPFGLELFPDISRAEVGFGNDGLSKLIKDIDSEDIEIVTKSLNRLFDEMKDLNKYYRGILELNLVDRLNNKLQHFEDSLFEDVVENIFLILELISGHYFGAESILRCPSLINYIYDSIEKNYENAAAVSILVTMAGNIAVASRMISEGHLNRILKIMQDKEEPIKEFYILLSHLIERDPIQALQEGIFDHLFSRLQERTHLQPLIVKCFALLLSCNESCPFYKDKDVSKILYDILRNDNNSTEIFEFTALALQNATLCNSSIWRCREFWDLPLILIKRANNKNNDFLQIYCLQILRQITQMPSVKNVVRKTCKTGINNIQCRTDYAKYKKLSLLEWLRRKSYKYIDICSDSEDNVENDNERGCEEKYDVPH